MKIFHIFTVAPIDVKDDELPAVQYLDYYLVGESLQNAFEGLREFDSVSRAAEVYGAELDMSSSVTGVIVWPESQLNQREMLGQHRHWANVQDRYTLLAKGAESLDEFVARRFVESYPQFA